MHGKRPISIWWPGRERRSRLLGPAWLLLCLFASAPLAAEVNVTATSPESPQQLRAVMLDPHLPTVARQQAALSLLGRPDVEPADLVDALAPLLGSAEQVVQAELADALARATSERLIAQLVAIARNDEAELIAREGAVLALGRQRDRAAAAALIALIDDDQPGPLRQAAFASLATLAGRDDLGHDAEAWQAWWQEMEALTDRAWYRHLLDNLDRRHEQARRYQQSLESSLVDAHRTIYRAAEAEARPTRLIRLLEDPVVAVRQLGVDLSVQRLVDDQPFDEPLREALRDRLDDASPTIRQRVTLLLRDLADGPAAERVAHQLAEGSEQVEAVLRAKLLMMSRLPRVEAVERSLALLGHPRLRGEAAAALAAAIDAERLTYQQGVRALQQVRRDLDAGEPALPAVVQLLGKLGGEDDWQRIEAWLDAPDEAIKQAAAQAWADSNRPLMPLLSRLNDPRIEPIALLAASRRGQTTAAFRRLTRFEPGDDQAAERWRRAMEAMAGRMPAGTVLGAVRELAPRETSAALCRRMLSIALEQADASSREIDSAEQAALLLARGRLRLAAGEAENALADFDRLTRLDATLTPAQRAQQQRGIVQACLASDALDRAFETAQRMLSDKLTAAEATAEAGGRDDAHGDEVEAAGGAGGVVMSSQTLLSENDSPLDLLFEAADRSALAGQTERLDRLVTGIRTLAAPSLSPSIAKRLSALEAQSAGLDEAADTPPADPAEPEADAEAGGDADADADGPT